MENIVFDLFNAGIAVELLVPGRDCECTDVGVRLRPYAKRLPNNRMILGAAPTFMEALIIAVEKAEDGRWESLDWSKRPWTTGKSGGAGRYGL